MTVEDRIALGLVGVLWGGDLGVVDLRARRVIMYCYAKRAPDAHWWIPQVEIESDYAFVVLVPDAELQGWDKTRHPARAVYVQHLADRGWQDLVPAEVWDDEVITEYANWDEVCNLLLHPEFDFEAALTMPENPDDVTQTADRPSPPPPGP